MTEVEDKPQKVSRTTPNLANVLAAFVSDRIPELVDYANVWITGSSVWSFACGEDPPPGCDLDIFVTNKRDFGRVRKILHELKQEPATPRPKKKESSKEGERIYTSRGWIDLWMCDVNENVFDMLAGYPADSHSHCRVAFQPKTRALVMIANERSADESEWCERQSVWWAERAIRQERAA